MKNGSTRGSQRFLAQNKLLLNLRRKSTQKTWSRTEMAPACFGFIYPHDRCVTSTKSTKEIGYFYPIERLVGREPCISTAVGRGVNGRLTYICKSSTVL